MIKLTKEQIKSIAEDVDMGMNCYIHKVTGENVALPNLDEIDDAELWDEELKKVEDKEDQFIFIEKIESYDSFKFMERFLREVANPNLREKLATAISQNKPFRRFRNILDANDDVNSIGTFSPH